MRNGFMTGTIKAEWMGSNLSAASHTIDLKCTTLKYTPNLTESHTLQLSVDHTGDISGYLKFRRNIPLNITVNILQCPVGFYLSSNNTCTCQFNKTKCTLSPNPYVTREEEAWIGLYQINSSTKVLAIHSTCPYDYCKKKEVKITTGINSSSFDQDCQCNYNRTGLLCGMCKPGLSMVLGSSHCKKCSSSFLFLIIIFALAGLLLVILLIALNLTIAEGTLSGLIFYANIVKYNHALFEAGSNSNSFHLKSLNVFIAWLNLDLGVTTCFYDGMDAYQKAWLQFLFPIYIWMLSIAIIFLSDKSQIVATLASKNAVKVLATLVLLSYTKFTQASVRVLAFATLTYHDSNADKQCSDTLWLEDGNVKYFEEKHLILFVFAVFFGAVSLPFSLMLLCIKPLHCISHKKPFRWVQRLKPFLDAFTGPYTDYGRFWPGLLLLARLYLSVISGIDSLESGNIRSLGGISIIVLLFAASKVVRPGLYTNGLLDNLETFFLLNLGFLYLVTIFYIQFQDQHSQHNQLMWYRALISLAFLAFIGIVLYHIWLKIRHYRYTMVIVEKINAFVTRIRKRDVVTNTLNNFPPFAPFNEDREPLLADHEE